MKKIYRSSVMTMLLFVMAAVLLFAGTIGGTQAALSVYSDEYNTNFALKNIGVTLYEMQGAAGSRTPVAISYRDYSKTTAMGEWSENTGNLVKTMVADAGDSQLKFGKAYPFELCVGNSGQIDTHVRVTLYKYWVDENGNKITDTSETGWFNGEKAKAVKYDPTLIKIAPADNGMWELQDVTDERMVFYYKGNNGVLAAGASAAAYPLTKTITIDPAVLDVASVTTTTQDGVTVTKYEYAYDKVGFVVEAQVDAVQVAHDARSVPSAWGKTTLPGINLTA